MSVPLEEIDLTSTMGQTVKAYRARVGELFISAVLARRADYESYALAVSVIRGDSVVAHWDHLYQYEHEARADLSIWVDAYIGVEQDALAQAEAERSI
jgi:hypothetical protein